MHGVTLSLPTSIVYTRRLGAAAGKVGMLHEGSKKTKGKMQNEESESSEACTLCFFSLSLSLS